MTYYAVILAAGLGKRMGSETPKVLHIAADRTLLAWVLDAVSETRPDRTLVVVGFGADLVRATLPPDVDSVLQKRQMGTGHATSVVLEAIPEAGEGDVMLVVAGDVPLVSGATLERLLESRSQQEASVAMLTAIVDDPTGYGRVVRSPDGLVSAVVEHRDLGFDQQDIREINSAIYAFDVGALKRHLPSITTDNAQGEYYLTDVIGLCARAGERVVAVICDADEVAGVNDPVQLAEADRVLRGARMGESEGATVFPNGQADEVV